MFDLAAHSYSTIKPSNDTPGAEKLLRFKSNPRTAGSMPVWEKTSAQEPTGRQKIQDDLTQAASGKLTPKAPENALAYKPELSEAPGADPAANKEDGFGFSDLLDMVNPFQHVPVLSHFYREISGDMIKPISRIIGGAVFGGPVGAGGALVNVIVEEETGGDLTENALGFVSPKDSKIPYAPREPITTAEIKREQQAYDDLPAALLTFSARPVGYESEVINTIIKSQDI